MKVSLPVSMTPAQAGSVTAISGLPPANRRITSFFPNIFTWLATNREACHHLEFLRFSELENGVLFATIHPKDNVLPYLAEHFTDRLPSENFMIYDATHQSVAVHKALSSYILTDAADLDLEKVSRYSSDEEAFRQLWLTFFDHIAIESRKNPGLQMQLIPKRYWADTPEYSRFC